MAADREVETSRKRKREYMHRWRLAHLEICLQRERSYLKRNRTVINEKKRLRYYAHRSRLLKIQATNFRRPEVFSKRRESFIRLRYGIDTTRFEAMLLSQHHQCPICERVLSPEPRKQNTAHIDHDHESGMVRGLLCGQCNRGIGLLKDDIARLRRAVEYLEAGRRLVKIA